MVWDRLADTRVHGMAACIALFVASSVFPRLQQAIVSCLSPGLTRRLHDFRQTSETTTKTSTAEKFPNIPKGDLVSHVFGQEIICECSRDSSRFLASYTAFSLARRIPREFLLNYSAVAFKVTADLARIETGKVVIV